MTGSRHANGGEATEGVTALNLSCCNFATREVRTEEGMLQLGGDGVSVNMAVNKVQSFTLFEIFR